MDFKFEKGRTGGNSPVSHPPPSFPGFGMPGKGNRTPVTRATGEAAAATQPSILSFFGRGNGGAPKSAAKQPKAQIRQEVKSNAAQQLSSPQVEDGHAALATATTSRAGKRRRQAEADEQPGMRVALIPASVDLTTDAATTETATTTPAAAAAAAAVVEKPRKSSLGTAPNVRRGKQDRRGADGPCPAAAAAAAVASTPNAKASSGKHGPLSPAGSRFGRGGAADVRSPETDSETSPAALVVSKRGHAERGAGQRGGRPRPTKRGREVSPSSTPAPRKGGRQEAGRGDGDLGRSVDRAVLAGGLKAAPEEERRRPAGELSDEDTGSAGVGGGGKGSDKAGDKTDGEEEEGPQCYNGGGNRNKNGSKQGSKGESKEVSKEKEEKEGAGDEANEAGEEDEDEDSNEEEKDDAKQENADDEEDLAQAEAGGISQYELQRLERIKRNQAFMATLGLATAKPPAASSTGSSSSRSAKGSAKRPNKKRSRPVSRASDRAPAVPVRRSARARGAEAVDYSEDKQAINAIATAARAAAAEPLQPEPVLEEVDFDDSTVFKYLCEGGGRGDAGDADTSSSAGVTGPMPEGSRVVGLRVVEPGRTPLSASGLSTIYTMHFCGAGATVSGAGGGRAAAPPLLAAGGKGGIVALFSTQRQEKGRETGGHDSDEEEDDERTLMNFKAHKGWVSAVRFLEGGGGSAPGSRLLSSANDAVVKLWDTSKQHRGSPRLLCTLDDLHPTRKGIFSMDSFGTRVATGSKDTTVAIASVRPTGLELNRVLGDIGGSQAFHEKVVKGVSLRDENTVASCGDDSNVRVSDLRSPSFFGVSQRLDGVHDGRPCHTVRWHPLDGNLLLSAGLDSTVKLHDLRHLASPLHVFQGHCPYALARPRAIHRPEFFLAGGGGGGSSGAVNIITCGEKSEKLSMYDAGNGATISRGVLGDEASALAVGDFGSRSKSASAGASGIAAALPGGNVVLLEPVWGTD